AYPVQAQEGRLQRIRDQVHSPDDNVDSKHDSQGDNGWSDFLSELFGDEEWGSLCLQGCLFPFILPRCLLVDHGSGEMFFRRYPYEHCFPGYLMGNPFESPESKEKWCEDHLPRGWSVRVSVEDGNDFSGLYRFHGTVLAETAMRFG